ncbi:MAG: hypothetical protein M3016_00715 [Actinomycetota bacterium]|nr:hypothetical protein [Actinomycetota bacterium]
MSSAKLVLGFVLAAVSLSACGIAAKPEVGSLKAQTKSQQGVDDPRKVRIQCLRDEHVPVQQFSHTWLQVGAQPSGPTIHFAPTPGAAQEDQISGAVQGAEVIGSALLYPNQAPDGLLSRVEACVAKGVTG